MNTFRLTSAMACALVLLFGMTHVALGIPSNDNCANAKAVGDVTNLPFDTTEATFDGPGHYLDIGTPNIWYCYTASCTGCATVSLAGSSFNTKLAVYRGCSCYPASSDLIKSNDDFEENGQYSLVTFSVTAGQQYLIEVGGFNENVKGEGVITISCDSQASAPGNDDCINADSVGNVTGLRFDTTCATFDGSGHCVIGPNLWYLYRASSTGDVTIKVEGLDHFDPTLGVYLGSNCYPRSSDMVACNDDFGNSLDSQVTFAANAGRYYLIEVGGYNEDTIGSGVMTITPESSPPSNNDDCINAQAIGDVKNLAFDTRGKTFDGPGLCMTSPNIWYCYTASCTGEVTVSLLGSSYDTMLAIYTGCGCNPTSSRMIECNDDFSSAYQSQITFEATAGAKYLIEIGGYGSNTGQGILKITCESGPSVDMPDLGDAPDSTNNFGKNMNAYPGVKANYPTVFDDGSNTGPFGPIHLNDQLVAHLGKIITAETEADKGTDEDGLKNINPTSGLSNNDKGDDGVVIPLNLPDCRWTTFDYTVNVIDPDVDLYVNVWFDWNRDGDWDDTLDCAQGPAREWAVRNQLLFNLPVGLNKITTPAILPWHPKSPKEIWMRITLSELPFKHGSNPGAKGNAGSGPQDKYLYGETEDYFYTPDTSFSICEDFNGDGVIDTDDLVAFTAEWLENCPE